MNKTLFVFLLAIGFELNAQTIIPKIGSSIATTTTNSANRVLGESDVKSKIGLLIGVACDFKLGTSLSIQPELLFHQKGYRDVVTDQTSIMRTRVVLNYIELPLLVKYKIGNFYINAGPSLAYGVGGRYTERGTSIDGVWEYSGKMKFKKRPENNPGDLYQIKNPFDFGIQFGGGVLIAHKITVDLRYDLGMSDFSIAIDDYVFYHNPNPAKNRSLQLTVGTQSASERNN